MPSAAQEPCQETGALLTMRACQLWRLSILLATPLQAAFQTGRQMAGKHIMLMNSMTLAGDEMHAVLHAMPGGHSDD